MDRLVGCVVPEEEEGSALWVESGPSVQLGRSVRSSASKLGEKELKGGREAVDGLNKPLFLPPLPP